MKQRLFRDMSTDNPIEMDGLVLVCVFQACSFVGYVNYGRSVHGHVIQRGFETNLFNSNSLIDMYSKCLYVNSAYMVFIQMTQTNLVSWNCILSSLVENEKNTEALLLFASMKKDGVVADPYTTVIKSEFSHNGEPYKAVAFFMQIRLGPDAPNSITLLNLLEACSTLADLKLSICVHGVAAKSNFSDDLSVATALLDAYAKCVHDI